MAAEFGIISVKSKVLTFETKEQVSTWGRKELENSMYLASWEVISIEQAKLENLI